MRKTREYRVNQKRWKTDPRRRDSLVSGSVGRLGLRVRVHVSSSDQGSNDGMDRLPLLFLPPAEETEGLNLIRSPTVETALTFLCGVR